MAKLIKIIGRSIGILFEWVIILFILLVFVIRTSPVQTYFAQIATNYLSDELDVKVKIDRVSIVLPNNILIEGLLLKDEDADTLAFIGALFANLSDYNLEKKTFELNNLDIENTAIHLKRNDKGFFNYQFIKDKFSTPKKKKSDFQLNITTINLANCVFQFDDERYTPKDFGVDYFHLRGKQINAVLDEVEIRSRQYSGVISSTSLFEKSGFYLNNLKSSFVVSQKGIFLSNLKIESPGSTIDAPIFNMLTEEFKDFKQFVDKVKFDGQLNSSKLALAEVAYFAPILKGMNDTIVLSTLINKEIKNLKLANIDLTFKEQTNIKGTLNIPDYRKFKSGFYHENIDYAYIDLKELSQLKMPDSYNSDYIKFDARTNRLGYFKGLNINLDGFYSNFVLASEKISTALGSIRIDNGLMFTRNEQNNSFMFDQSTSSSYDLKIESFDLGQFIGDSNFGIVDGLFFLSGETYSFSNIQFRHIEGEIGRFDYLDYPYTDVSIRNGQLVNNKFDGEIEVNDDNLELSYIGFVDFKNDLILDFKVNIKDALLKELNISNVAASLLGDLEVKLNGASPNDFAGNITLHDFAYKEKGKEMNLPNILVDISRGNLEDKLILTSDIVDAEVKGKFDLYKLPNDLKYQIGNVLPALYDSKDFNSRNRHHTSDNLSFDILIKSPTDFLSIFSPDIRIAANSSIRGHFLEEQDNYLVDINSDWFEYKASRFDDITIHQVMDSINIAIAANVGSVKNSDTTFMSEVYFKGLGTNNILNANISWGRNTINESALSWETKINNWDNYQFILEPSFFSVRGIKWGIENSSTFSINRDKISVNRFELIRNEQVISIDGEISKSDVDKLNFDIKKINLAELSYLFNIVDLFGELNANGSLANPYTNFNYIGDANIDNFRLKGQEVGNIELNSEWIENNKSLALKGEVKFRNEQTFNFIGDYYPFKDSEKLDFNLFFDQTDIKFANALMSPDLITEIEGSLNGSLKVTGSPDNPILNGAVILNSGSAKVEILGTHFGINGPIDVDQYGFYINGIPITDEEGNGGKIIGSVYHDNFADFNFDLLFDIEDDAINKNPKNPWEILPLKQFLVLKTEHILGDSYYGTGYGTGIVNIFGYSDNLEITVDLESRKGTIINIPMYGIGEIDEEDFIVFIEDNNHSTVDSTLPKIDFTGVDLDLNFKITDDAIVKLIFDDEIGDEITARGFGDISINLNNIGDITMDGLYTVKNGVYDFAMGPVKLKFFIEEGGNISWTGNPYDANLNLSTFYKVNTNIAVLTNNKLAEGSGSNQEVLCYLKLSETLNKPAIDFDIKAPNATDIEKSVISRIKSDPDELNRQFFSLLLWRKFQPISGTNAADGSTALDLVTNQLNSLLSKISSEYMLNLKLNADQLTGDNSYEFGLQKSFLDNRLLLSGSFGVENQKIDEKNNQNNFIGDLNFEYLLNEPGTFRVNIFNESNDKTIIQNEQQGTFTQGAGLRYKEDFHTLKDFKAIQYFLDFFRAKKNRRYLGKNANKKIPLPNLEEGTQLLIKPNH